MSEHTENVEALTQIILDLLPPYVPPTPEPAPAQEDTPAEE